MGVEKIYVRIFYGQTFIVSTLVELLDTIPTKLCNRILVQLN